MAVIREDDFVASVADALQFISYYHPADYIRHLTAAYEREESTAAKEAIAQILVNSRMAAIGHRPMCQDTGVVNAFVAVGLEARVETKACIEDLVNEGARRAYLDAGNPLRASIVADPLFSRGNTRDNTPAVVHTSVVPGDRVTITLMAKGGGSENKARFAMLNPSDSVADWVVRTVEALGAGWCPPGMIGLGVGGSADMAMLMAKQALFEPIDMQDLLQRGPASKEEELRIELYRRINALGIGAQGLGGLTTVVDVKLRTHPTHAASMPVGLIPQCAANRHITFTLDGDGPATFTPPALADWPQIALDRTADTARRVDLDTLTRAEIARWRPGEKLLLSGRLLTGRDAAHKRIADMKARGEPLPVDFTGRVIYYVGPVDAVGDEAVGPAGPTTATRMDKFTEMMLAETGLIAMIGKAERGQEAIDAIARHRAAYLIAVGGSAVLVSQAIRQARRVAFEDLGMEAIYEFTVEDMPVTVAVDAAGQSVHRLGPAEWRRRIAAAAD
ncbi:fumarate hydratase [Nitratireductor pacificus]|uniref:Fumarate hydratase class I n=1 Tax=Nitratireductor pacificus pht-3B TaxID=391937 RepID=K2N1M1_9HYPH|nr:fumarate hydratase [Nitratireductor pacificus]EKF18093.1 fumarate hydratase [Nitratireductor pacificus pht-3B]